MGLLSLLAAIITAVIFYESARVIGKSKFWWSVLGFVLFLFPGVLVNLLYEKLIWRPVVDLQHFTISEIVPPTLPRIIVGVVGIICGALFVYFVHREFLKPEMNKAVEK